MATIQALDTLLITVAGCAGGTLIGEQIASYQVAKYRELLSRKLDLAKLNNETLLDYKGAVSASCYYHLSRTKARYTARGEIWIPTCVRLASMRGHTHYTLTME
ncbi:hypothetical protein P3551_22965 [Vibrio parahaemolyticus]|nr:hypothetical protein [Vibrio parahaemolyticus]MDF4902147.1 hypothetical protein [Vibrio parahaemolyticus]HCG8859868.1 hypothetical protein [Vibrio parahaemolyticus]HCM0701319.1 hypothetical protein [Vibrio parahaemolyticus]